MRASGSSVAWRSASSVGQGGAAAGVVEIAAGELLDLCVGERVDLHLRRGQLALVVERAAGENEGIAGGQVAPERFPLLHALVVALAARLVERVGQQAEAPLLERGGQLGGGLRGRAGQLDLPHARQEAVRVLGGLLRGQAHEEGQAGRAVGAQAAVRLVERDLLQHGGLARAGRRQQHKGGLEAHGLLDVLERAALDLAFGALAAHEHLAVGGVDLRRRSVGAGQRHIARVPAAVGGVDDQAGEVAFLALPALGDGQLGQVLAQRLGLRRPQRHLVGAGADHAILHAEIAAHAAGAPAGRAAPGDRRR